MRKRWIIRFSCFVLFAVLFSSCKGQVADVQTGADQIDKVLALIDGKNVAIVANQTSLLGSTHLVDTLMSYKDRDIRIVEIFTPEHGFRGNADAGAKIEDQKDMKTGLPLISLYGKNKKPAADQLAGIDIVIFDIQDIGVRFYTYISTLKYVMEACAENNIQLILLDRPNPNGNYIDGPVLEMEYSSFVGMFPIPVVYGLTIGELAMMINGEAWLPDSLQCDLTVVPCLNYNHQMEYDLPVKPSPNLPNAHSVRLYPSICFFEGTVISEGRGTYRPFEIYGHPDMEGDFSFTPESIEGMSMFPKFKGIECYGKDLSTYEPEGGWSRIELKWLIDSYEKFPEKDDFFIPYFEKLAGTDSLRMQIENGRTEEEIRESWQPGLYNYMKIREKYLLYP